MSNVQCAADLRDLGSIVCSTWRFSSSMGRVFKWVGPIIIIFSIFLAYEERLGRSATCPKPLNCKVIRLSSWPGKGRNVKIGNFLLQGQITLLHSAMQHVYADGQSRVPLERRPPCLRYRPIRRRFVDSCL